MHKSFLLIVSILSVSMFHRSLAAQDIATIITTSIETAKAYVASAIPKNEAAEVLSILAVPSNLSWKSAAEVFRTASNTVTSKFSVVRVKLSEQADTFEYIDSLIADAADEIPPRTVTVNQSNNNRPPRVPQSTMTHRRFDYFNLIKVVVISTGISIAAYYGTEFYNKNYAHKKINKKHVAIFAWGATALILYS